MSKKEKSEARIRNNPRNVSLNDFEALVNKYGYHSWVRKKQLKIEQAQLGPEAPMIGAALLYKAL